MTAFQKRCMATIDRALGRVGQRPTYQVRPFQTLGPCAPARSQACVHADFHVVQDAYEMFIYPDEVAVSSRGQRRVLALRDFGGMDADLQRSLGELLQLARHAGQTDS